MTAIHDITLQCPLCGTWFASRTMADETSHAVTCTDFQRRVNGADPLAYQVHMCTGCGFAGAEEEFASDDVAGASATALSGGGESLATRTSVAGSEKYEAAAAVLERRGGGARAVGDMLLRAAWCCVSEGDTEAERFFRRKAARAFAQALESYDGVPRSERAVLAYLVGELWRRVGERDDARRWFDRVSAEATDPLTQRWVVTLAAQQRDRPREWLG